MPKPMKKLSAYVEALQDQIDVLKDAATYVHEENGLRYRTAWNYYLCRNPLPLRGDEMLDYVEPVVFEAVSALTPSLLSTFTDNDEQVVSYRLPTFAKVSPAYEQAEKLVNEEINKIFLRENKGYAVLEAAIKEALITGDAFIKYFIEEKTDTQTVDFPDYVPFSKLMMMADGWTFDVPTGVKGKSGKYKQLEWKVEKSVDETGAPSVELYLKGKVDCFKTTKSIKVEQVDYKDVLFDPSSGDDFEKCRYFAHKKVMTIGDALALGYPEEFLKASSTINVLDDEPLNKEQLVIDETNAFISDNSFEVNAADELERRIYIWEHYLYSSLPTGETALYQVVATDNDIISVTPISRIPFVHPMCEVVPGSIWGRGLYDTCRQYQDELSHLIRIMKQRSTMAAFGVWQAVKGSYDRRSLLGMKPGQVVEVQEIDNVQPLHLPDIPPSFDALLSRLRDGADRLTASTTDQIVSQEGAPDRMAAQTLAMLINQSEMKDKVIAKAIARTGIAPLFEGIFELMRTEGYVIVSDNGEFSCSQLPNVYEFVVDVNTKNDAAIMVQGLNAVVASVVQFQQSVGDIISPAKLYNFAEFQCKQYGLDAHRFFDNPAEQQMTPEQQQEQFISQQAQKETGLLTLDAQRADIALKNAQTALVEAQLQETLKNGDAQRERDKEKSVREYHKLDSETALNNAKAQLELEKLRLEGVAVGAEVAAGQKNITGVRIG